MPPFVSKRTIRTPDEGWSGVGGTYVCGTAAVQQVITSYTPTDLAKMPNSSFESLC